MVPFLQFIEQLAQLDFGLLDVKIEFISFAALAFGTLLRLIPQGGLNTKTIAETDSDGTTHYIIKLADAYKVSGDSFYM